MVQAGRQERVNWGPKGLSWGKRPLPQGDEGERQTRAGVDVGKCRGGGGN